MSQIQSTIISSWLLMEFIIHFAFINFFSLFTSVFLIYSLVCFALPLSCESWGQWACLLETLPGRSDISVYPLPHGFRPVVWREETVFLRILLFPVTRLVRGRTVNQCEPITTVLSSAHRADWSTKGHVTQMGPESCLRTLERKAASPLCVEV